MSVYGDRLSIDQRVYILSIEHAQVNGRSLASKVFFMPSSFCHSCMGKITFWTSIWMQFHENISRAKVLLQLFFWLWFYSSLAVCLIFFVCLFFQLKSTVCIDNIMKKYRVPFIFSVFGLFIYSHAFILFQLHLFLLTFADLLFSLIIWPDRGLDA